MPRYCNRPECQDLPGELYVIIHPGNSWFMKLNGWLFGAAEFVHEPE